MRKFISYKKSTFTAVFLDWTLVTFINVDTILRNLWYSFFLDIPLVFIDFNVEVKNFIATTGKSYKLWNTHNIGKGIFNRKERVLYFAPFKNYICKTLIYLLSYLLIPIHILFQSRIIFKYLSMNTLLIFFSVLGVIPGNHKAFSPKIRFPNYYFL